MREIAIAAGCVAFLGVLIWTWPSCAPGENWGPRIGGSIVIYGCAQK
jgi:hypothetical protein